MLPSTAQHQSQPQPAPAIGQRTCSMLAAVGTSPANCCAHSPPAVRPSANSSAQSPLLAAVCAPANSSAQPCTCGGSGGGGMLGGGEGAGLQEAVNYRRPVGVGVGRGQRQPSCYTLTPPSTVHPTQPPLKTRAGSSGSWHPAYCIASAARPRPPLGLAAVGHYPVGHYPVGHYLEGCTLFSQGCRLLLLLLPKLLHPGRRLRRDLLDLRTHRGRRGSRKSGVACRDFLAGSRSSSQAGAGMALCAASPFRLLSSTTGPSPATTDLWPAQQDSCSHAPSSSQLNMAKHPPTWLSSKMYSPRLILLRNCR